jgi:hypothetical protein
MGFLTEIKSLEEVPQFEVEKVGVNDSYGREIPGVYSLQREDTNQHLGMVGETYRPIQMREMVDVLDRSFNAIGGVDHKGYAVSKGGRKVLIQSKLAESFGVDGDQIDPYFYTVIDNTGMGSNKVIPSTIRIACDNALHLIKGSAANSSRHSARFDDRVETMIASITDCIKATKEFDVTMRQLKSQPFTWDEMMQLTQKLVPAGEEDTNRRIKKRERIANMFTSGRGNVGETRWDALNAVTEFETHTGRQSPEKLIRAFNGHTLSQQTLALLS